MSEKNPNPIWKLLSSVKLALFLLFILAIASVIGTVIQQQEGAGIYHSAWFRFIILALAVNLVVCSIDRFPATLKLFRITPNPDRPKLFEEATVRMISFPEMSVGKILPLLQEHLGARFSNLTVKENGNSAFIYCEKGRFSLFSVYLVHLSVLIIIIGAVIGSIFGFSAYVNIPEGGSVDSVIISNGDDHSHKALGFSVRCEDFFVDYYDNGVPKEYRSDLRFIVNGKEAGKGSLRVNHPINFMGITFYQSSYGTMPGEKVRIKIINDEQSAQATAIEAELGKAVILPDNRSELTLSDIRDNFMDMLGPAALITVKSPEGKETTIWLLKDTDMMKKYSGMFELSSKFNPSAYSPYTFQLDEVGSMTYTGLQVTRDPGVKIVFAGFLMIVIGLFLTFFTSHRRFWIRVADEKGEVKLSLTGIANKNAAGMERALDRLLLGLKKAIMEGRHNG